MALSGEKYEALAAALISAFPNQQSLLRMVRIQFDLNLATFAGSNLEESVYNLIDKAEAEGWTDKLILGARDENPGNPKLAAVFLTLRIGESDSSLSSEVERNAALEPTIPDRQFPKVAEQKRQEAVEKQGKRSKNKEVWIPIIVALIGLIGVLGAAVIPLVYPENPSDHATFSGTETPTSTPISSSTPARKPNPTTTSTPFQTPTHAASAIPRPRLINVLPAELDNEWRLEITIYNPSQHNFVVTDVNLSGRAKVSCYEPTYVLHISSVAEATISEIDASDEYHADLVFSTGGSPGSDSVPDFELREYPYQASGKYFGDICARGHGSLTDGQSIEFKINTNFEVTAQEYSKFHILIPKLQKVVFVSHRPGLDQYGNEADSGYESDSLGEFSVQLKQLAQNPNLTITVFISGESFELQY